MNILLILHEELDHNSGAAGSVLKFGAEYEKLGHSVLYYSIDHLPKSLSTLAKKILFPWFVAAYINQLITSQTIDIVDASPGDLWVWNMIFHRFCAHPPLLVTRSHGLWNLEHFENLKEADRGQLNLSWRYFLYRGSFKRWEVAYSLRCTDLVYLLNHQEKQYITEQLHVPSDRAQVVANGIPEEFINLPFASTSASSDAVIRIAQVGTYVPRKGVQYSAPALNTILIQYPQVSVSFLGTQCPVSKTEAEIYEDFDPEVRDRVQVIPRFAHERLPELLKGHQIKLFTPISEGFGKALVEAMACGLAPVATAVAGPLEIVRDGYDAIVIPPRDRHSIEQALTRLINDRIYLDSLRCHAYETAQCYDWHLIAKQRLEGYVEAQQKLMKSQNTM